MRQRDHGEFTGSDAEALPAQIREAVADIVRAQLDAGVDVVNDGEMGKIGYSTYVRERLSGFGGEGQMLTSPTWASIRISPSG